MIVKLSQVTFARSYEVNLSRRQFLTVNVSVVIALTRTFLALPSRLNMIRSPESTRKLEFCKETVSIFRLFVTSPSILNIVDCLIFA